MEPLEVICKFKLRNKGESGRVGLRRLHFSNYKNKKREKLQEEHSQLPNALYLGSLYFILKNRFLASCFIEWLIPMSLVFHQSSGGEPPNGEFLSVA